MKAHYFSAIILFISMHVAAQNVSIGNDGNIPDQSAMLDIKSSNKGVLVPRLTAAQRNGISLPAKGLLVYQVESPEGFYYNAGTPNAPGWIQLSPGPQTPQGAPGIVKGYYTAGTAPYPTTTNAFISPTVTITIVTGQSVHLSASRALGGYSAAHGLCVYPAAQLVGGGGSIIMNLNLGLCGLQVPANTRTTIAINGVFENLPAGTYKFGMSGFTQGSLWTNAEWGYVSALVY